MSRTNARDATRSRFRNTRRDRNGDHNGDHNGVKTGLRQGWKILVLRGDAYTRGKQHGAELRFELSVMKRAFPNMVRRHYKVSFDAYLRKCAKAFPWSAFSETCPEWARELEGIANGSGVSVEFLLAWNMYLSMAPHFEHGGCVGQRCCAFIATGEATKDGKIVMAHNTHAGFDEAPFSNIISYIYPDKGHPFVMQTMPGLIASSMDWFITSVGMMGCETTIGEYTEKPDFGGVARCDERAAPLANTPYFCRIRECMQYGTTINDYKRIMLSKNAGDYACSWLFGDANTNEIAMLELGKNTHAFQRTTSGAYVGANWAHDDALRQAETTQRLSNKNKINGSYVRTARLEELVFNRGWGKMDVSLAKLALADHYNPVTDSTDPGGYSVCRHMELEPDEMIGHKPFDLYGSIDGKVATSDTAKKLEFWARWGSSCGRGHTDRAGRHPWTKIERRGRAEL